MSDHNAEGHSVGTENQRRLLSRESRVEIEKEKIMIFIAIKNTLVNKYFKYCSLLPCDSFCFKQ